MITSEITKKKHIHMNVSLDRTPRFDSADDFLELTYSELMTRNLKMKRDRDEGNSEQYFQDVVLTELKEEERVKAVTVCFSDMEGKLHMLDYNKDFFLDSHENLTFDGSSIRGFTPQHTSDLRLKVNWSTMRWLPADIFGPGKVLIFTNVHNQDGSPYIGDFRSNLSILADELRTQKGYTVNIAPEIEGFILDGENAEQNFREREGFKLASEGGYFNALPQDKLRIFIDQLAEATRALAFENEKDHPEVAPAQFEMNYKYTEALHAADQIQIYKLVARQIAKKLGLTASFLPKPVPGINGSGMHSNISISQKGRNIFYDTDGDHSLSEKCYAFINGVLSVGSDLCLALNASVNAYRRLDPKFEAPNEIKVSPSDRGSMIRIPLANSKSARIEVRTVGPDANPYLAFYLILKAGLMGMEAVGEAREKIKEDTAGPVKKLPGTITEAIRSFRKSDFIKEVMTDENRAKYIELKQEAANRAPASLGTRVKAGEIWYHHEVTNQVLWGYF